MGSSLSSGKGVVGLRKEFLPGRLLCLSVDASMEQTSTIFSSVAAATDEMSATVGEISSNSEKIRMISGQTSAQTKEVSVLLQQLREEAHMAVLAIAGSLTLEWNSLRACLIETSRTLMPKLLPT